MGIERMSMENTATPNKADKPRRQSPYSSKTHLLILGAERSGTSLLAAMIGRHSEAGILYEETKSKDAVTKILGKKVAGNKLCLPNQIRFKRQRAVSSGLFRRLGFPGQYPRSRHSLEAYLKLPNLKILSIIRNGNDVISSNMKYHPNLGIKGASDRWCMATEIIHELKKRHGGSVMVVSFEGLVSTPEQTARDIVAFLGLDFEERMLDGYKFTPVYNEAKINQDRAGRSRREGVNFDLERKFPAVWRKYEELLALCQNNSTCPES